VTVTIGVAEVACGEAGLLGADPDGVVVVVVDGAIVGSVVFGDGERPARPASGPAGVVVLVVPPTMVVVVVGFGVAGEATAVPAVAATAPIAATESPTAAKRRKGPTSSPIIDAQDRHQWPESVDRPGPPDLVAWCQPVGVQQ
jgi:hypothetical protein